MEMKKFEDWSNNRSVSIHEAVASRCMYISCVSLTIICVLWWFLLMKCPFSSIFVCCVLAICVLYAPHPFSSQCIGTVALSRSLSFLLILARICVYIGKYECGFGAMDPCDAILNMALYWRCFATLDNVLALTHRIPFICDGVRWTTAVENRILHNSLRFGPFLVHFVPFSAHSIARNSFISIVAIQRLKSGQRLWKCPQMLKRLQTLFSLFIFSANRIYRRLNSSKIVHFSIFWLWSMDVNILWFNWKLTNQCKSSALVVLCFGLRLVMEFRRCFILSIYHM